MPSHKHGWQSETKNPPSATEEYAADGDQPHDFEEDDIVVDIEKYRSKLASESTDFQPKVTAPMSDTPSRPEIAAELRAAEARTETRIAQLTATMEARAMASDHKSDMLAAKMDGLSDLVSRAFLEGREDNKHTRRAVWEVGIGAVIAVLALVVALWIAGLSVQSNMLSAFQAGIGVRGIEVPTSPPAASPSTQAKPTSPAGK